MADLKTIKKKRATRRGRLTTLKRQLDDFTDIDVRAIDLKKLATLRTSIEKECATHQELQNQVEELLYTEEGGTLDESILIQEADDGANHQSMYSGYLDTIDTLVDNHRLFHEAKALSSGLNDWLSEADPSKDLFSELRDKKTAPLEEYLARTESRADTEIIKCGREELKALLKRIYALSFSITKTTPIKDDTSDHSSYRRSNLDIELPTFNGDPLEWADYYALFSSTMDRRAKHFTKEEKCCLLVKSLKDTRAKSLAQATSSGPSGYDDAIEALIERYGRPSIVLPRHVKRIQDTRTLDFDRDSLLHLIEKQIPTYHALKDLRVDLSTFLVASLSTKFTPKLAEEWTKHCTSLSSLPTMEDLATYAKSIVCRMPSADDIQSQHSAGKTNKRHNKKPSSASPTTSSSSCVLCQEGSHSLTRCSVFKEYTPERRGKFVRDNRWCSNCLHPSHTNQHCPSTFTCKNCGGRHHTLLHKGDSNPTSTNPPVGTMVSTTKPRKHTSNLRQLSPSQTSHTLEPPTHAFLSTALVKAVNGHRQQLARLALDSGSSTSLVTESLASHLKLKRYPQRLSLVGAYGGGSSKHYVKLSLRSQHNPTQTVDLILSVVSKLPYATPPLRTEDITSDVNVKDLQLADNKFGGSLDILLGNLDVYKCLQGKFQYFQTPDIAITPTLFGWVVSGPLDPGQSSRFLSITTSQDSIQESLQKLWEIDTVPTVSTNTNADEAALRHFEQTHSITPSGRYSVSLPRVDNPPSLGKSRKAALSRFLQNESSLKKKGKLEVFNGAMWEYHTLNHAEPVPREQLHLPSYYLPVHGVFKDSSSTTKVRPVFDASAKSSTNISLNDALLTGPNLYPLLTDILIRFRRHRIGYSADISKMFREILLNIPERDFHRFLMRNDAGNITDYRMKRLTFGVKPSPFLATKVIRHLAECHTDSHPLASNAILNFFYVDDFLSGSDTVEEAMAVRTQLCSLLSKAGMTLRKWRSSNEVFINSVPSDLQGSEVLTLADAPKALGVHWDVSKDTLQVATPKPLCVTSTTTKHMVASEAAKLYDVLGLFAPFVIRSKIILQHLWKLDLDWDEEAPEHINKLWQEWIKELPLIHDHAVNRRYDLSDSPIVHQSLHGFSDASESAYGAVVYLRRVHQDGTTTLSIVISKARVAPLKAITIPRAELVAAHLLSKLLSYAADLLDIPMSQLCAWSDSTIVLCWLRKSPTSLKAFVANRVAFIQRQLPDVPWRHISTKENPADFLSRGVSATSLAESSLWWEGPQWLTLPPTQWKVSQPKLTKHLPEQKVVTLVSIATENNPDLATRYSSFSRLVKTLSWIHRFATNCKLPVNQRQMATDLTLEEMKNTGIRLLINSQQQTYPELRPFIKDGRNTPKGHSLSGYRLHASPQGLITVSGRVRCESTMQPKERIVLSLKSTTTRLFINSLHRTHQHPGTSTLMAVIAEDYHIPGLKGYLKKLSRECVICQQTYAKTIQPPMGLLPIERTTPTPPFYTSGVDFAGPLTIRQGYTRKPVLMKAYICLFVCFSTRAIHLELCTDLTTEAFMAALRRFCARRGTPHVIHSDNGANFVGAASELKRLQQMLKSSSSNLNDFASAHQVEWSFIPPRAPNFGGLWEAGVKQMKLLLRKQLAPHPLRFDELTTVLADVEALLNSRPIVPLDSTEADCLTLTPGHFLIGRPLKTPARPHCSASNLSSLRRWNLVLRLQQDLWNQWRTWYLQTLQRRAKWNKQAPGVEVDDIVLLKDETLSEGTHNWPLARVTTLYRGNDGVVRAADVTCKGKTYRRSVGRFVPLFSSNLHNNNNSITPPPEYVQVQDLNKHHEH